MPMKVGNIELYMGPKELGGPDDLKDAIISFISKAKPRKRLNVAVQELDNMQIAQALMDVRDKKAVVRLVLEGDYLSVERAMPNPLKFISKNDLYKYKNEMNRHLFCGILRSNINVKTDYNSSIFHQKFIVRGTDALLTGSTNFTYTGVTQNLNHLVIIKDKKIAKIYNSEFSEIMQGHFGKLNEGHDPVPPEKSVSDVPVKVLFAPDHNPEMEIMKQMLKAKHSIEFAIFTFSESSGIDDTMKALANNGIKVRGVFDGSMGNHVWAATHELKKNKVEVFLAYKGNYQAGTLNKLHHKMMVIDNQVVILGSFNYTGPANKLNDENIIILGDLETKKAATIKKQKKLAGYAQQEIERIIQAFGKKM